MADSSVTRVAAQEYTSKEFLKNFTTAISDELWMNTTFYTFTNFVTEGKQDNILKGATVLDLGCGGGAFSRWAIDQGASKVLGIDLSEEHIRYAREATDSSTYSTIEYLVGDASTYNDVSLHGQFDIVFAVHLICYAQNMDILTSMLRLAMSCLKKGGKMFGVREVLDTAMKGPAIPYIKEEMTEGGIMFFCQIDHPQTDFTPSTHAFRNSDGTEISFINYMVSEATMIKAFTSVGFEIDTIGPLLTCTPKGMKMFPREFMRKILEDWGKMMWYFKVTKPKND